MLDGSFQTLRLPLGSAQDLLLNAGWIPRFAAGLATCQRAVDDMLQDNWLAAIQHSPQDGRPVSAWLSKVLRNAARQHARSAGRRSRRECETARAEERDGPSEDALERFELQRQLADIVAALEEPYSSTVVLRDYEGLSAAETGRREEIPAGTVRW